MTRPMEVQELIQALLEARQPHARVVVQGHVTCDEEHPDKGYVDVPFTLKVVGLHGECNVVRLEVEG